MSINFEDFSERGGWWVIAQFGLFAGILMALTLNTDTEPTIRTVGWALVVAALALGGAGLWLIRSKLTAMPAPRGGSTLIERGPYALVRHPIYGALVLGFLGLSIRGGNPAAALLSLLLVPFFYAKTNYEEKLLVARFPEYADYRQRVPRRFLPWVL